MTFSKGINASQATLTKARTGKDICHLSGMCVTCLEGCPGLCEVGKSAYRGKEVLYPGPFGKISAASQKDYPVDYSHLNIMGTTVGAQGIEADSDIAVFPNVSLESEIGREHKVKLKTPVVIAGMGSTDIAKNNWPGLGAGAAIAGAILVVGENVCGMDPKLEVKDGRVVNSPNLVSRVKNFQDYYNGYGTVAVQNNVEDTRLGVAEYAIDTLGVDTIEVKWGQGAKDIGGEVKLGTIERARQLKSRGYVVIPDPDAPGVEEAFKAGAFKEFERHSRVGMAEEEAFLERVEYLRKLGAKRVFLKTGAYRPADLALALRFASKAGIDMLTVDGAGGGTGMSPWRMMNEWGVPTIYLQSMLINMAKELKAKGKYVPDLVIAGGFALEDHLFKAFAMGDGLIKAVGLGRAPLTAAMVGKTIGGMVEEGKVAGEVAKYGDNVDKIFASSNYLKNELGAKYADLPAGAMGVYTYFQRVSAGLQQLMAGTRKFKLEYLNKSDLVALTKEAAEVTGVDYVFEADKATINNLLNF